MARRKREHSRPRLLYAVQTGGKPLPLRCVCDDVYGRDETDVRVRMLQQMDVEMDRFGGSTGALSEV